MNNYKKIYMALSMFAGVGILLYVNTEIVSQPHINKSHQYVYKMTNYALFPNINSSTNNSPSTESMDPHIPIQNKTITIINPRPWIGRALSPEQNVFNGCEVSACQFHHKNALKYVNESDAVIFYAVAYPNKTTFTRKHKQGQIWVFATMECPYFSHSSAFKNPVYSNKINWTMTYRLDSDIPIHYANVKKITRQSKNYTKIMAEKTKLVAQIVSHCQTPSLREQYIKSLNTSLPVTVFGSCGPTKKKNNDVNLHLKIAKSYKFYLSFENSLCRDYITEKFFVWQNRNIVPIVRGYGNYEHFYPKNSFINVRDFKSISDLAEYIKYLDKNNTAYVEYLKAKENYIVTSGVNIRKSMCQLCKMVHNPKKYTNNYSNVQDWHAKGTCRNATDLDF